VGNRDATIEGKIGYPKIVLEALAIEGKIGYPKVAMEPRRPVPQFPKPSISSSVPHSTHQVDKCYLFLKIRMSRYMNEARV
jgi:hypothetical protein